MPAIGARTTGGPMRRFPRTSSWGTTGTAVGMAPIVPGSRLPPKSAAALALRLLAALGLLRLRLRRQDLTGPLDGVELLVGTEADRLHRALVRGQEDQAGREGVLGLELLRQRVGRTAVERRGDPRGRQESVLPVDA